MNICTTSLCIATLLALGAEAATCTAVNVNGGKASALRQGAEAAGLEIEFRYEVDFSRLPDVLVWQADEKGTQLTDEEVAKLAAHLAKGAGLVISMAKRPGLDAFRLTPVSPTTAWQTLMPLNHNGEAAPGVKASSANGKIIPIEDLFHVPYHFRIRPLDAAELGETRLESHERAMPFLKAEFKAGEPFVSRPLLNRDWTPLLEASNKDLLMIAGRYGAGRVAVFASTAETGTAEFWKHVFTHLAAKTPSHPKSNLSDISFSHDGSSDEIIVKASNKSATDARVPLLARVSSWNGEYIGDVQSTVIFPAGKTSQARLKVQDMGRLRQQSLDYRRSYRARVAVFSPDCSEILGEGTVAWDHVQPISVNLVAPDVGTTGEPIPGPDAAMLGLDKREGVHVGEYCFRPETKQTFKAVVKSNAAKDVKLDFDLAVKPFNGEETVLEERLDDTVKPKGELVREFEVTMPKLSHGEKFGAGRIELVYKGKTVSYIPYIVTNGEPDSFMPPREEKASKEKNLSVEHDASSGLTNWAPDGAGRIETEADGGSPESIVFAYSRRLNQTPENTTPDPSRLFLAESGFTGNCNPWSHTPGGDRFMDAAQSEFMERLVCSDGWKECDTVTLKFGDCWDVGPSVDMMFSWQEIVEFDRHLRASGRRGLMGRTYDELKEEILQTQTHQFLKWQFETYLANFRQVRDQIESRNRKMAISGSGMPLMPPKSVQEFAEKLGAMTIDPRLGAIDEDMAMSVARTMALKALNPMWRIKCGLVWGRDNSVYSSQRSTPPVGTTETSRRHAAIKAWRSIVDNRGACVPIYSYGFDDDGAPPLQDENDLQQKWHAAQRAARIRPDGPIGMGLCLGAGVLMDDNSFTFSGGGKGGNKLADTLLGRSFRIVGELQRRGIGVPFAANATALMNTQPSMREPLLIPLPDTLDAKERRFIATWAKSRGKILFVTDGKAIAPEFAELFGGAEPQAGSEVVSLSKYGVMIDRELELITQEDFDLAAKIVCSNFNLGTSFPPGVSGYGFTANRRRFVALHDEWGEGRQEVAVKLRAGYGKSAVAMEFNEHRRLPVERDGDYWKVTLPLKKADGNLVMIEEN